METVMSNEETTDYFDVEETVGVSLLKALLQEVKLLQKPWQKLSKREQDDVIDRLRSGVEDAVVDAVIKLAAKSRPTLAAVVDQVTFKDGVKAVLKLNKDDPARHHLADATGDTVLLVVAAPKDETANMDGIQGEEDQRALGLNQEYDNQ